MNEKLNLLSRFFSNKYSRNDYIELKKMILSEGDELENLMNTHWTEFKTTELQSKKDLSEMLAMINHEMDSNSESKFYKKLIRAYSRVAAILVFPLLLALGFLYIQFSEYLSQKNVYVEVQSPTGSRTHLNLPDGSSVWLNGDSHIKYPAVFNKNREVEISGEAFFKVKSNQEHPFLVSAKNLFVRATGTEFNVLAYRDDPEISVILKEGEVAVLDAGHSELRSMDAGHELKYQKSNGIIKYSDINTEDYSGWINGRLIFRNALMEEVVNRMERWYGVDIEVADKELLKLHFKATFINESVEEALKLLQSTATFDYRFAKRQVGDDDSYKRAKIYITKK